MEVTQAKLLASRDEYARELEITQDAFGRVAKENEDLKEELRRLKVWIQMEKTMLKTTGTISNMPSFASFDHATIADEGSVTMATAHSEQQRLAVGKPIIQEALTDEKGGDQEFY